jgi:hypothetical protein
LEDEMNKKQRIILSVGILLVIFNGLFPPYEGELRQKGDNLKNYMGYLSCLLPRRSETFTKLFSGEGRATRSLMVA